MRRFLTPVLALVLTLPAFAGKDRIFKKGDPKPLEGTIEKEDLKEVAIKLEGSASSSVTWDKVASIEYGDEPLALKDAKGTMAKGDKEGASEMFAKAAEGLKEKPLFLAHALYYRALCLQQSGKFDDAIRGYDDLIKTLPSCRFFKEMHENRISCFLAKNDSKGAADAIAAASTAAKDQNVDQPFQILMNLKEAEVLEAGGDTAQAKGKFLAVSMQAGSKYAEISGMAKLGAARCELKSNAVAAQGIYESITREFKGQRKVLGAAWTGLGDCLLQQGTKDGDLDKLRRAALAFEQTVVLYFPGEGASTTAYEQALTGGGQAFLVLAQKATTDKARGLYAGQARSMALALIDQFPSSVLKSKADEIKNQADEELAKVPKK